MKTRNFLMTLGAVALATITFNAVANDALLSPRAAGNQIVKVAGTNNGAVAATCSNMAGTPKAIAACAEHPGAPMPCCAVASVK